jgi:hypothetical protein
MFAISAIREGNAFHRLSQDENSWRQFEEVRNKVGVEVLRVILVCSQGLPPLSSADICDPAEGPQKRAG